MISSFRTQLRFHEKSSLQEWLKPPSSQWKVTSSISFVKYSGTNAPRSSEYSESSSSISSATTLLSNQWSRLNCLVLRSIWTISTKHSTKASTHCSRLSMAECSRRRYQTSNTAARKRKLRWEAPQAVAARSLVVFLTKCPSHPPQSSEIKLLGLTQDRNR